MRLDKFLCDSIGLTRSQAGKVIRASQVQVDGQTVKDAGFQIGGEHQVRYAGQSLRLLGPRYFMLNKPAGYICANEDADHPCIFQLFDEPAQSRLHSAGRLDLDTTGLVLVSDDGQWSHRVTSPRHACAKTYRVWLAEPVAATAVAQFAEGVQLHGERSLTRPAELALVSPTEALLTIHEGKYHQVKRMFAAIGNKVVRLHREQIGPLQLDPLLEPGAYRPLSAEEIAAF